jgi:hypothetical protein
MGEELLLFRPEFNGSIRVEPREEKLTAEAGSLLVREVIERLKIGDVLGKLTDPRNQDLITHPLSELVYTELLLLAQGWRDEDDADTLRDDPALRLAISERRGVSPLERRPRVDGEELDHNPPVPDGLASQPTLSRLTTKILSDDANRAVLRDALFATALHRHRAARKTDQRQRSVTLDIDSLPIEVHGHQPGSEHNGHYHARVYHPIIAGLGETGDLLDTMLRPGNVHTAEGALDFVLPLVDRVEKEMCQVAAVRVDAGFPEEKFLAALEARRTPYVARVKNNPALDRMAESYVHRPPGRRPAEPREWFHDLDYKAASWSRSRRVVLVVQERPGDLYLHHFWLITNWTIEQIAVEDLLALYRQRGTAEGHWGELMSVLDPALSSSPRTKDPARRKEHSAHEKSRESFAANEARLLLNVIAYNLLHVVRTLMEDATGEGWSLKRTRERVLRVAARVLVHARRAVIVIAIDSAKLWCLVCSKLRKFRLPSPA